MKQTVFQTGVEGLRRLLYLVPSRPEIAQIEITNRCNFDCKMCQRIPLKVPLKDMDFRLYKKIVDRLEGIRELILTGWGEPLMHPQIFTMIKYAHLKGKKVSLTSNGSLLTSSLAKKVLNTKIESISFSVDEIKPSEKSLVHPVRTQLKNIESFLKTSRERKKKPLVTIQSTLHEGKQEKIQEVVEWAATIGADIVNINRLDVRFNSILKRPNLEGEKKFVSQLDLLGKKLAIRTEFRPHLAFSGVARILYRRLASFMHRGGKHCLRVYNYIYVNMKGEVTPCCALPLWSVGNLLKEDLIEIWQSEKFQKFRRHDFQRKICNGCDVLEVKQYA